MKNYLASFLAFFTLTSLEARSEDVIFCNTENAKAIKVLSSRKIQDKTSYVKAASGLAYLDGNLYIIQDSSRYLAQVDSDLSGKIQFHPLADMKTISELEDPKKSYKDFRKDRKADYEAITSLPDGRLLIFGSGYDAQNIGTKKQHYKNTGVLFNPKTKSYETLNLEVFYKSLLARSNFVGGEKDGVAPRLNIEAATVFEGNKLAIFHRSNYNKNSHDAMIVFPLEAWLKEVHKPNWELKETRLLTLNFGMARSKDKKFPINLNDVTFQDGSFIFPLASEADTIVNGKDVDGEVIWTGLAKITLGPKENSCSTFRFSDPKMPKIEGLTPNPKHPKQFFAVHDVDSEELPSLLSVFEIQ